MFCLNGSIPVQKIILALPWPLFGQFSRLGQFGAGFIQIIGNYGAGWNICNDQVHRRPGDFHPRIVRTTLTASPKPHNDHGNIVQTLKVESHLLTYANNTIRYPLYRERRGSQMANEKISSQNYGARLLY